MSAIGKWLIGKSSSGSRDGNTLVLWVFRDYEDRWCVRIEGEDGVREYPTRADAAAAARLYGSTWGSYRLYLQLKDGRVTTEMFNLRDEARLDEANIVLPFLRPESRSGA